MTSVPTRSPSTTRLRLCALKKSNTMIGILLSMQREKAVESITLSRFAQGFQIGDLVVTPGLGMGLGVAVVNAIHLGGFENHFRADFVGAQGGGRVGGKIGIARAAAENDHPVLFQMAHGAAPDERLGDLRHGDGALHAGGDAEFFQGVLQGQRVDDGGRACPCNRRWRARCPGPRRRRREKYCRRRPRPRLGRPCWRTSPIWRAISWRTPGRCRRHSPRPGPRR